VKQITDKRDRYNRKNHEQKANKLGKIHGKTIHISMLNLAL